MTPSHVPGLSVTGEQGVEHVLINLNPLVLHQLQYLAGPLDVPLLAVPGDEALEGLLVGGRPVLPHVLQHLLRPELVPVLQVDAQQGVVVHGGQRDLLVLEE